MKPVLMGVYRIKCMANNRAYIGSSVNIQRRFYQHLYQLCRGKHGNKHLQNAWDKYGEVGFKFMVIEITADLIAREEHHISVTKSAFNYINQPLTRPMSFIRTAEHNARIGLAHRGRTFSTETRAKMSVAHKGKKLTPKTRQRMALAHTGLPHSLTTRDKIRKSLTGRSLSLETRQKLSAGWAKKRGEL